jgi:hypothetical protein
MVRDPELRGIREMNKWTMYLYELPPAYENAASLLQRLLTPNVEVAERFRILLSKISIFRWSFAAIFCALEIEPVTEGTFYAKHVPRSAVFNRPKSEPHYFSVCAVTFFRGDFYAAFVR